ncbi:hypothetical protein Leryth_020843 [Lithospermum erythrorhizon]|nr:hypothetical protein Leryth_020843 [Lithospermum erythrorhizon]
MSFPDPNQPPSYGSLMPMQFPGSDNGGFWPQFPGNYEQSESNDNVPPFKRQRNMDGNPPVSAPFPSNSSKVNPPSLGKGSGHIFYKTRMCVRFVEGTCRNGEVCTFAHGNEDLREPPPNWQDLVKDKGPVNWNDDQRAIQRMKICKRYYNGEECPYGEKCTFLHERPVNFQTEMPDRQRESSVINIGTVGPLVPMGGDHEFREDKHVNCNSEAFRIKPVFWKTKICSKWEITGHCPFGERCHFAHGNKGTKSKYMTPTDLQGPGMFPEGEPLVKSGQVQPKPFTVPVDAPPANVVPFASNKEDEEQKMSKWKLTKKVNRIYADWLDDLSPLRESNDDE